MNLLYPLRKGLSIALRLYSGCKIRKAPHWLILQCEPLRFSEFSLKIHTAARCENLYAVGLLYKIHYLINYPYRENYRQRVNYHFFSSYFAVYS